MYFKKTPSVLKQFNKDLIWKLDTIQKKLYLTFDDGPVPEVTDKVLDILSSFDAKATFFCVGNNVEKHPQLFHRIVKEGHSFGNHTHSHKNGWKTSSLSYLKDYLKCQSVLPKTRLFRPPYGRISPKQIRAIKTRSDIIMWDVLSGDFDQKLDAETCAKTVIENVKPGSIIVMHDSLKSKDRVLDSLPLILTELKDYVFAPIDMNYE